MSFENFRDAVRVQFDKMSNNQLYTVAVDKDVLWDTYLDSFPAGTNEIFRERREHDCSCCKSFVRAVGNVVAIIDGNIVSIWDVEAREEYMVVAAVMSVFVKAAPIENIFFHFEGKAGVRENYEQDGDNVRTWKHFHADIPTRYILKDSGSRLGEARACKEVLERSIKEIDLDTIETVLDLINQGSLYRGDEHLFAVKGFKEIKKAWSREENPCRTAIYPFHPEDNNL